MLAWFKQRLKPLMLLTLIISGVSLGSLTIAHHPNLTTWEKEGTLIRKVAVCENVVALTFDDGPDPINTPVLLEVLQRHQARATFFVMGERAQKYPQIVRQIAANGHEVGNHSYSHADFNRLNREQILEEIRLTNQIIAELSGQTPRLFRPPGGYLSYEMVDLTVDEGMLVAYWTWQQDSKDWRRGKPANKIAAHIIKNISPGQIIILHDAGENGMQTAKAVDILLTKLEQEGYRFVTMGELLATENLNKAGVFSIEFIEG